MAGRRLLVVCLALSAAAAAAQSPAGDVRAAWVELAPGGPLLRVVTGGPSCPRVAAVDPDAPLPAAPGWRADAMRERAAPAPPAFPDRVCDWPLAPPVAAVAVEGWPHVLRRPAATPRRIVAFGDSGCAGAPTGLDCARDWSFPALARHAARRQPDLVIHLGDYNYRGTTCTAYDACCAYDPDTCGFPNCGDEWSTWRDDFFAPAGPLLAAAPWVMARGNHELCSRAGRGYFRYLDPHPTPPTCAANPADTPTYTEPYAVALGAALRLLVLDAANACGEAGLRDQVAPFRGQFARLAELAAGGDATQTWLVSHKPPWGVLRALDAPPVVLDYTLQQASGNRLPAPIDLVLSGHMHLFQALTMTTPDTPVALIAGSGGAELDDPRWLPARLEQVATGPGGPTIGVATTLHDHGYLLIELAGAAWTATFFDRDDQPLAVCDSTARPSACRLSRP